MKEITVKLERPYTREVLWETHMTLPEAQADLVQDWIEEWLPKFLGKAISFYDQIVVTTRELGKEE
ncbi:hypothetical protein ES707_20475 [subsurface metagenome]